MEYNDFVNSIDKYSNTLDIKIDENQKKLLYIFMDELLEWNKKVNLTAIRDEEGVILKHFVDSIFVSKFIGEKVIDIGSGAGFPGIPLKIVKPEIELVSIDSVNKKLEFQRYLVNILNLSNVDIIHTRAEELGRNPEYRETFDTVISRAVASLQTLVEYMLPFAEIGGMCICMKNENCDEEVNDAKNAIKILGGKIERIEKYTLSENVKHSLIFIRKVEQISTKFPRKIGTANSNPLK